MKSFNTNDYDWRAKYYDLEFNDTSDYAVLRALVTAESRRVLEIPCGSGRNCRWLAASGKEIVFGDLSPNMVAVVDAKLRNLEFAHRATAECLDMTLFQVELPFDLILVPREGFQMLPRKLALKALRNFKRNLSVGGRVYLDVAVADLSKGARKDRLPRYIAEQGKEFVLDIESRTKPYSFVRRHRSKYEAGKLHVTFAYEVIENNKTKAYTTDFEITGYDLNELTTMAAESGMHIEAVYGDYDLTPLFAHSPRILLILKGES